MSPEHVVELRELHVTSVLSKPFTAEELLTAVKEIVSR